MSDVCDQLGIPKYLWTEGRHNIEIGDLDSLYRRVPSHFFETGAISGKISATAFPLKNDSYNLASLCQQPQDVLFSIKQGVPHFLDDGIIQINVSGIRAFNFQYSGGNNQTYECTLKVIHKSEKCMYPHSEICVFVNGVNQNPPSSRQAKEAIRLALRENHDIIMNPPERDLENNDRVDESFGE